MERSDWAVTLLYRLETGQQAGLKCSPPGRGKEHPRLLSMRQARCVALVRMESFPLVVLARPSSCRARFCGHRTKMLQHIATRHEALQCS